MKYDDLEKTQDLFEVVDGVPIAIENIEMEGINKEKLADDNIETLEVEPNSEPPKKEKKKKAKKEKKSLKEKWKGLSTKKKVIIIISIIIVIALITFLIIFLIIKNNKKEVKPTNTAPKVIVEKENYIYKDGILTFIDEDEKELGTYECTNKDEKLCYVAYYTQEDEFDGPRNVYEDKSLIEKRTRIYQDNYVFIYDNSEEKDGPVKLYDIAKKEEKGTFNAVKGFDESNYVILTNEENKYGAIEIAPTGIKDKINYSHEYIGALNSESNLVVKEGNKSFIYNLEGKSESKEIEGDIKSYDEKYIVADNNGYSLYDYDGEEVIEGKYEFISLLKNYIALVQDKKLYIKDYKDNKYNEDGIALENDYYNETNIYDENKRLIETKRAFAITAEDNNISITYATKAAERTKVLDTNDSKLSNKLEFMNYFDGNLYFYNDEDKKNLIGSYTCVNKNNNKNTDSLSNCFIASDTFLSNNGIEEDNSANVGWIPIFNERFVYIQDTNDLNNSTIFLYDLKNNKTIGKYSNVDTGSYTKENKVKFVNTDNTYVISINKTNIYGLVKISNEATLAIPFEYSSLEKFRDYYMGKNTNTNSYVLVDNNNKEKAGKYEYKITDYKGEYVVVNDGDTYYIYDQFGKKINENKFYQITMYDDYYVVVDINKKLNIHKYEDEKFELSHAIELDKNNYKTDYEVTKTTSGFEIKVKSTNKTYKTDNNGLIEGDLPKEVTPTASDNSNNNKPNE